MKWPTLLKSKLLRVLDSEAMAIVSAVGSEPAIEQASQKQAGSGKARNILTYVYPATQSRGKTGEMAGVGLSLWGQSMVWGWGAFHPWRLPSTPVGPTPHGLKGVPQHRPGRSLRCLTQVPRAAGSVPPLPRIVRTIRFPLPRPWLRTIWGRGGRKRHRLM